MVEVSEGSRGDGPLPPVRHLVVEVSDRLVRPAAPLAHVHVPQQQPRPQRLLRRRAAPAPAPSASPNLRGRARPAALGTTTPPRRPAFSAVPCPSLRRGAARRGAHSAVDDEVEHVTAYPARPRHRLCLAPRARPPPPPPPSSRPSPSDPPSVQSIKQRGAARRDENAADPLFRWGRRPLRANLGCDRPGARRGRQQRRAGLLRRERLSTCRRCSSSLSCRSAAKVCSTVVPISRLAAASAAAGRT